MGIFLTTMALFIFTFIGVCLGVWLSLKKTVSSKPIDVGTIHIIVENGLANKAKVTDRESIIAEAEILFFSLQKKYLYSPVPFKVLGDFYVQNGLSDKALEKYSQMIRYLNADLTLEKLADALLFMQSQGADKTILAIEAYYKKAGN